MRAVAQGRCKRLIANRRPLTPAEYSERKSEYPARVKATSRLTRLRQVPSVSERAHSSLGRDIYRNLDGAKSGALEVVVVNDDLRKMTRISCPKQ
jgi:hypothetical protein